MGEATQNCDEKVSGEAGSVAEENIKPWLAVVLPRLLLQYKSEDVCNEMASICTNGDFYPYTCVTFLHVT